MKLVENCGVHKEVRDRNFVENDLHYILIAIPIHGWISKLNRCQIFMEHTAKVTFAHLDKAWRTLLTVCLVFFFFSQFRLVNFKLRYCGD